MVLVAAFVCFLVACNRADRSKHDFAYVAVPQAFLRDRVAAIYNKVAVVKNGEKLEVLEKARRFVRVRTAGGTEGWIEQRFLAEQDVYDGFQKLASDTRNTAVVGKGVTRNDTNIHLTPDRDSDHLYQIKEGEKLQILKRATAAKPQSGVLMVKADNNKKSEQPKPMMEDWWLVRDSSGHAGWVLSRMVDLDVPLDIAQYAEGQRIVGAFVLNQVTDEDKKVPQYLVALTEPHDGEPFDYNQVRVFTWNVRRHRYETAYRERNLYGVFPLTVSAETFDKEGVLPTFTLHVQDDSGKTIEKKYKLNTPIVKRVLSAEEQASEKANPTVRRARASRRHHR